METWLNVVMLAFMTILEFEVYLPHVFLQILSVVGNFENDKKLLGVLAQKTKLYFFFYKICCYST